MREEDVTLDSVMAIPKPWGQSKFGRYAITANGEKAMAGILLLHAGCVDAAEANRCIERGAEKELFRLLADGASSFIEQHREHASCVEQFGFTAESICTLMALYKIQMLFRAGVVDVNGKRVASAGAS